MDNFYYNHTRPMNFNGFYEPNLRTGWIDNERLLNKSYMSNADCEYNNMLGSFFDNSHQGNWVRSFGERHLPVPNWSQAQNWLPVQYWNTTTEFDDRYIPSYNLSTGRGWNDRFIPSQGWMNARGHEDRHMPMHVRGLEDRFTPSYNHSVRGLEDQFYPSYSSNVLRNFDSRYVPNYGSSVVRDIKDRNHERYLGQNGQFSSLNHIPHNNSFYSEQNVYEPATYFIEEHDSTVVQIELFGVSDKDFRVMTMGNNLIIEGFKEVSMLSNQKSKNTQQAKFYFMGPVWHGAFKRVISLDYAIEASLVNASFSNGVLTLTVKKPQSHKSEFVKVNMK